MQLERNSIIAVTLLFMTGCSASHQALQSENDYNVPEPVPMPIRHADECDSGQYDDDSVPQRSESPSRSVAPVPMQEPAPAPPAIGVSRIKSISWLRNRAHQHDGDNCSEPACADGCSRGEQSELPLEFFAEGCVTPQSVMVDPRLQCREKTTLFETIQGWNQRAKIRRAERGRRSLNCGSQAACDPGCFAPEGCQTTVQDGSPCRKSGQVVQPSNNGAEVVRQTTDTHGNLADPLREYGWDDRSRAQDSRFSLDELLELPSTLTKTPVHDQQRSRMPIAPMIDALPVLPLPEEVSGRSPKTTTVPSTVPQQVNPDSVQQVVQPPLWPRLVPTTASADRIPVALPMVPDDPSLPTIQPGHRI